MTKKSVFIRISIPILIIVAIFILFVPLISRAFLTTIAKTQAEKILQSRVDLASAELHVLQTSVVVRGLKVHRPDKPEEIYMAADKIALRVHVLPFLTHDKGAISISLEDPEMTYETDRQGNWVLSKQVPLFKRGKGEKRLPVNIDKIVIDDGKITNIDHKVAKDGLTTTVSDIDLEVTNVRLPSKEDKLPAEFEMDFDINDRGHFEMEGEADFLSPQISFEADMSLAKLNIVPFAPYYQSSTVPVTVQRGIMAMKSKAACKNDYLNAPAHVTMSDLQVKPKSKLMGGLPAQGVVDALKERDGTLEMDMVIKGNIRSPRFLLATDFTKAFAGAFTSGLINDVGKDVKGSLEKAGEGVKEGVGKGMEKLKGLFK